MPTERQSSHGSNEDGAQEDSSENYEDEEEEEEQESAEEDNRTPPRGFRSRLFRFFSHYEPSQCQVINQWMENWRGREDDLMVELVRFHGPEPSIGARPHPLVVRSAKQRLLDRCGELLTQFFLFYSPEKFCVVTEVLKTWQGQEEVLLKHLEAQASNRNAVFHFFRDHFPQRMNEVPGLLRTWLGHEQDLITHLAQSRDAGQAGTARSGVDTTSSGSVALGLSITPPSGPVSFRHPDDESAPYPFKSFRQRLTEFYRVYNPEKLDQVDEMLVQYEGREDALFRALRKKYVGVVDEVDKAKEMKRKGDRKIKPEVSEGGAAFVTRVTDEHKRMVAFLTSQWLPEATEEVEMLLESFDGTVAQLQEAMQVFQVQRSSSSGDEDAANNGEASPSPHSAVEREDNGLARTEEAEGGESGLHNKSAEDGASPSPIPNSRTVAPESRKDDRSRHHSHHQWGQYKTSTLERLSRLFAMKDVATQTDATFSANSDSVAGVLSTLETQLESMKERHRLASSYMSLASSNLHADPHDASLAADGRRGFTDPSELFQDDVVPPMSLQRDAAIRAKKSDNSLSLTLSRLGLSYLYGVFVENEIDVEMLPLLTQQDLIDMGIEGHDTRSRILAALRQNC